MLQGFSTTQVQNETCPTILFTLFVAKNGHEDIIVDTFAIIKGTTRSLRGQAVFDDSKT